MNDDIRRARIGRIKQRRIMLEKEDIDSARGGLQKLVPKFRRCLQCDSMFFSEFQGNRRCPICKIYKGDNE